MSEYTVTDSGSRAEFDTGAVRDTELYKGRYDLIPTRAIKRVAIQYQLGAAKYDDRNWEKGIPFSRMVSSAKRHIDQWIEGELTEDHLAAACFNLLGLMHFEEMRRDDLDNLPDHLPVKRATLQAVFDNLFMQKRIADEVATLESWAEQAAADKLLEEPAFDGEAWSYGDPYWSYMDGDSESSEELELSAESGDVETDSQAEAPLGRSEHELCWCSQPRWEHSATSLLEFSGSDIYEIGWRDEDELCLGSFHPGVSFSQEHDVHTCVEHEDLGYGIQASRSEVYLGDYPNLIAGYRR